MWKEMLGTLKDISSYLEKSEEVEKQITQEKTELPKGVKAGETQDPLKTQGPGNVGSPQSDKVITKSAESMLKAEEKEDKKEEPKEDEESSETSEDEDDGEELKSILKDIRSALSSQTEMVKSEIKKALPEAVNSSVEKHLDKTLRKMGYHPTRPDVSRLGLDTPSEVQKSEDSVVEGDIKKSEDKQENDLLVAIDKLSKNTSWQQLGQMREKAGLFRPF